MHEPIAGVFTPGDRYGQGTVLAQARTGGQYARAARLRCDCGAVYTALAEDLARGRGGSCGSCSRRPRHVITPGDRYGRGTVIGEARVGGRYRGARMQCDCGAQYVTRVTDLVRGTCQSCGCLRREVSSALRREPEEAARFRREVAQLNERGKAGQAKPSRPRGPRHVITPGDRYGRGVVIGEARVGKQGERGARLQCDCGTVYAARVSSLVRGSGQSCGCLREEAMAAARERKAGRPAHVALPPFLYLSPGNKRTGAPVDGTGVRTAFSQHSTRWLTPLTTRPPS